jgi:hypothetical protein
MVVQEYGILLGETKKVKVVVAVRVRLSKEGQTGIVEGFAKSTLDVEVVQHQAQRRQRVYLAMTKEFEGCMVGRFEG